MGNEGSCVIMTIQDHPEGCNLHVSITIVVHCCCFLLSELNYLTRACTHTHTHRLGVWIVRSIGGPSKGPPIPGWCFDGYNAHGIKGARSNKKTAHIRLCKVWEMENEGSRVIMTIRGY